MSKRSGAGRKSACFDRQGLCGPDCLLQAGGGGAKAQARNMLMDAQRAAAKGGGAGAGAAKNGQGGGAVADPAGPDPRLRAPERVPVSVRLAHISTVF